MAKLKFERRYSIDPRPYGQSSAFKVSKTKSKVVDHSSTAKVRAATSVIAGIPPSVIANQSNEAESEENTGIITIEPAFNDIIDLTSSPPASLPTFLPSHVQDRKELGRKINLVISIFRTSRAKGDNYDDTDRFQYHTAKLLAMGYAYINEGNVKPRVDITGQSCPGENGLSEPAVWLYGFVQSSTDPVFKNSCRSTIKLLTFLTALNEWSSMQPEHKKPTVQWLTAGMDGFCTHSMTWNIVLGRFPHLRSIHTQVNDEPCAAIGRLILANTSNLRCGVAYRETKLMGDLHGAGFFPQGPISVVTFSVPVLAKAERDELGDSDATSRAAQRYVEITRAVNSLKSQDGVWISDKTFRYICNRAASVHRLFQFLINNPVGCEVCSRAEPSDESELMWLRGSQSWTKRCPGCMNEVIENVVPKLEVDRLAQKPSLTREGSNETYVMSMNRFNARYSVANPYGFDLDSFDVAGKPLADTVLHPQVDRPIETTVLLPNTRTARRLQKAELPLVSCEHPKCVANDRTPFQTMDDLQKHVVSFHGMLASSARAWNPLKCQYCPAAFGAVRQFDAHYREEHGPEEFKHKHRCPFFNEGCNFRLAKGRGLDLHLGNKHQVDPEEWRKELPYECTECDDKFAKLDALEKHHLLHEYPDTHKKCQLTFSNGDPCYFVGARDGITRHVREMHPE